MEYGTNKDASNRDSSNPYDFKGVEVSHNIPPITH